MISNDTLTPMQQTAQFYIPPGFSFHRRSLKRLNPQNDQVKMLMININQNLNMKSNSQPNLLNLTRDKNVSFHFDSQQQSMQQNSIKKQLSLLGIQQRLLFPKINFKKQNSLDIDFAINNISSPQKSIKMLKTLLMPQHKNQNIISHKDNRSTRSQGRSFLQSRPQLNLLNRIFSSKSQHEL